ncbi:succinate dehydrogenase, cytochrome b556 subunit [Thiomicrorhabdus sp. ZW0627]|uniref:succinate dehydrogenase, cytochrome b556 subunit n=1 Tax=Thiomicrorhabdus sp. ZW0627 TaxID=3039774 RepID=UPI0024367AA3|nr:succinate dehydrogenase, cytochrome b556 subunit [Thiomicrorhabdus sp. ZW0627]MDG6773101.1 succinate dehydrogenase, cytochrome b556 subunit [Thiomicrorhabdus sp. ZW0627]
MYQHPPNRPVYLSLRKFRFPFNAWLSAAHRITGLMLFISLLGYLALANLVVFHDGVTLEGIRGHCIIRCLNTVFWISLCYHWLSGFRHLLAEHFTTAAPYSIINAKPTGIALLFAWLLISLFIFKQAWSL